MNLTRPMQLTARIILFTLALPVSAEAQCPPYCFNTPYTTPPPPAQRGYPRSPQFDPYREFHSWGGYDRGPIGAPDPRPQRMCVVSGPYGNRLVPC